MIVPPSYIIYEIREQEKKEAHKNKGITHIN